MQARKTAEARLGLLIRDMDGVRSLFVYVPNVTRSNAESGEVASTGDFDQTSARVLTLLTTDGQGPWAPGLACAYPPGCFCRACYCGVWTLHTYLGSQ